MKPRRFDPLSAEHPAVGQPCAICEKPLEVGQAPSLVPKPGAYDPAGPRFQNVEAALVHADCVETEGDNDGRRACPGRDSAPGAPCVIGDDDLCVFCLSR